MNVGLSASVKYLPVGSRGAVIGKSSAGNNSSSAKPMESSGSVPGAKQQPGERVRAGTVTQGEPPKAPARPGMKLREFLFNNQNTIRGVWAAITLTAAALAIVGLGVITGGVAIVGIAAGIGVGAIGFGIRSDNKNAQAREAQQKAAAWNEPSDPMTAKLTAPMNTPAADAETRAYHESRYANDPNEFVVPTSTQGVDARDEPVPGNDPRADRQDPYAAALQHAIS